MSLFGSKEKQEIAQLKETIAALEARLSPEQLECDALKKEIASVNAEYTAACAALKSAKRELSLVKERVIELNDQEIYEDVALYIPRYKFVTVQEYKDRLDDIRAKQKELIKNKEAVSGTNTWTVNGSKTEGRKMVSDMQKLLLRAFNAECEHTIERVTVNNVESCEKRLSASCDAISKLGRIVSVSIRQKYYSLKVEELYLALEYQLKKQEEKEALREARARQREEAKLAKELEEERKKLEKEQKHYQKALSGIVAQLASVSPDDAPALLEKKAEIEQRLEKIDADFAHVDYRAANARAGYVYVISNIGAFGEGVYKIGMTRRLVPMERIDELGDASVPFDFDVHALIFSADAPALEAALHNAFADRKLNHINKRREFFRVSLDEIKQVVRENYDKTVEFIDVPPAEQYRQSLAYQKLL